jgi:hypothetical protein
MIEQDDLTIRIPIVWRMKLCMKEASAGLTIQC